MSPDPSIHPAVESIAFLLGTWSGPGRGEYPTIEPFEYLETITFDHVGKPFLSYSQRTKAASDGRPLHAESGYWRVPIPGRIEVILAHPTGIAELQTGTFDGRTFALRSATIARTDTAKEVTAVERTFLWTSDNPEVLSYTVAMAAVGRPLTHHLAAELTRQ